MIWAASLCWLACGSLGQAPGTAPPKAKAVASSRPDARCGSYSLYVALQATGFDAGSYEQLEKALGPPPPGGYSMLQLKEQAVRCGADALAVETTLENIRARPRPFGCVALLKDDHFVVFYDSDATTAYFIDDFHSKQLPIETFLYLWTKKALILGPKPLAAEESIRPGRRRWLAITAIVGVVAFVGLLAAWGRSRVMATIRRPGSVLPTLLTLSAASWFAGCEAREAAIPKAEAAKAASIVIEPASHDLGLIATTKVGKTIDVPTILRNVGNDTLEIREVRTSCSCTVSKLEGSKIPPGGQVVLKSTIKLGESADARRSGLTIYSSDPVHPAVALTYEWRVINPLRIYEGSCHFPRLGAGAGVTRLLGLELKGLALCDRCELSALVDSSLIKTTTMIRDGARSPGHEFDRSDSEPRDLGTIRVDLLGSDESGDYRHNLSVIVRCGEEVRAKLDVPVTWNVGSGLSISPARLSLGMAKAGERVVRRVVARSIDRKPFRVLGIESEPPGLIRDAKFDEGSDGIRVIEFGIDMPEKEGPWISKLLIRTDDRESPSINVPMSALIAGTLRGTTKEERR